MAYAIHPSVLLLVILLPFCVLAQTKIDLGSSLTAGDDKASPWLSPKKDFAFGFRNIDGKGGSFVLAIWFYNTPEQLDNIVWYPKGTAPAPKGSKVDLTADRGFVLNDPKSGKELWRSGTNLGVATAGYLNDTGNLVVSSATSERLWQSFENPADTILPGQVLRKGATTFLSSRRSQANFSLGRYQFRLQADGNLLMNAINLDSGFQYDAYYYTATVGTGTLMVFNESGDVYLSLANNTRNEIAPVADGTLTPPSPKVAYLRGSLSFDGIFTLFSFPKNSGDNGSWTPLWSIPENICTKLGGGLQGLYTGPCGYNSVCRLNNHRVACNCPPNFSLLDPTDLYGGCKPNYWLSSCDADSMRNPEDAFDLVPLDNTNWIASDYERIKPSTEEACKRSCLQDCMCAAAVLNADACNKKRMPLSYGGEELGIGRAFIKVWKNGGGPGNIPHGEKKKDQGGLVIVISALLGSSALFNLVFMFFMCMGTFLWYNRRSSSSMHPRESGTIVEGNLQCFTYKDLAEATNGYKEELGRGSFGIVYKGEIDRAGSKIPVAVKKLDRVAEDSDKEFKAEVNVIGQTYHKNLVRLLGFCNEGQNRLLVYEFLSNGTLASLLYGDLKPTWEQRNQIALGIGRGLLYLHDECETQVIHCDIKPQNILLDEYYNVRIADFGLAKLLLLDQSRTHTAIRGTKGYVAPEWFRNMAITVKVDVYSFGVLLLEIICCRRSVDIENGGEEKAILSDWAYDCYRRGTLDALVEDDAEVLSDMKKLERFVMVAIWCIQEDPSIRPTMKKVMLMLEGIVQVAVPPCPCPYNSMYN